jgi:iron complex outermembrane receptor protein
MQVYCGGQYRQPDFQFTVILPSQDRPAARVCAAHTENAMKPYLPVVVPIILALLALSGPSYPAGQSGNILVTATRLGADSDKALGHVTVISAADIKHSTARTLPELLARESGVLARSLYGNNGTRATVDIRGFGAASTPNTLILLDGRRLNDIDLSAVDYGAIPLKSIERIEILRNGGSVLYGDGASGGTINIITRQPAASGSSAHLEGGVGTLDTRQIDTRLNHSAGRVALSLGIHGLSSDGYRDNNHLDQRNLQADVRYTRDDGEAYLRFYWDDQDLGLPGPRHVNPATGVDELKHDRKGTNTPNDYADLRGYNTALGVTHLWENGAEAILDAGYRKKDQKAFFDDYDFGGAYARYLDSTLKTWSFTPRLTLPHALFGAAAKSTAGIDYYDSRYDSDRSLNPDTRNQPIHRINVEQKSGALYLDTTASPAAGLSVNLGGRVEWVRVEANDRVDTTAPGGALASEAQDFDQTERVEMLEAGVEKQLTSRTAIYIKATRSARVATVDELFQVDPTTFLQVFSKLDPQTGNGIDLGTRYKRGRLSGQANAYYMRLKNEIHYDPATFSNINLDPTQRYGLELSGRAALGARLELQASYTWLRAEFRDGPYQGNTVPLVPRHTASATATWKWSAATRYTASVSYVGEAYFDNDQANNFGRKIPSSTIVDLLASHRYQGYRFAARIGNLFAEKAYNTGISSTTTPGVYNAYPLPERTLLFTVSKEFST